MAAADGTVSIMACAAGALTHDTNAANKAGMTSVDKDDLFEFNGFTPDFHNDFIFENAF